MRSRTLSWSRLRFLDSSSTSTNSSPLVSLALGTGLVVFVGSYCEICYLLTAGLPASRQVLRLGLGASQHSGNGRHRLVHRVGMPGERHDLLTRARGHVDSLRVVVATTLPEEEKS